MDPYGYGGGYGYGSAVESLFKETTTSE